MDYSSLSDEDLDDVKENPLSNMAIFDSDDYEAITIIYIFKRLQFQYGMSNKPTGYHYEALKDSIKWMGLSPKKYVPLIQSMFYNYVQNLPSE